MGCDIHTFAEKRNSSGEWEQLDFEPFDWRSYGMYGFLANVRNYSEVPFISDHRGIPEDSLQFISKTDCIWQGGFSTCDETSSLDNHGHSWVSLKELLEFNYDIEFDDVRYTCYTTTVREFLGENFFEDLKTLEELGAERVVFYFDN